MPVKPQDLNVPEGLQEFLQQFVVAVLRRRPEDLHEWISGYKYSDKKEWTNRNITHMMILIMISYNFFSWNELYKCKYSYRHLSRLVSFLIFFFSSFLYVYVYNRHARPPNINFKKVVKHNSFFFLKKSPTANSTSRDITDRHG